MKQLLPVIGSTSRSSPAALLVLGLVLLGCAPTSPSADLHPAVDARLVLMGTTDIHGWLLPHDYYSGETTEHGLLLLGPVIDSIKAAHPGRTVLVDSGDLLQGNPLNYVHRSLSGSEEHPVIAAMNALDYDAAAIGNHEYNYGIPHLERAIQQAEFPFLSANTFRAGTTEHAFTPYTIVEKTVSGRLVRVGITGVTPPGVLLWDKQNVEGVLDFREIVGSVRPVVERMRAEGADVVVVASHGGLEGSSYDPEGTGVPVENMGAELARSIHGIDVIFLGHTHRELADTTIGGTLLLQAKNWGESLAVAELELEPQAGRGWRVAAKRGMIRRPAPGTQPEPIPVTVQQAHERTVDYVTTPVGRSTAEITSRNARTEDTAILDFINEVQRKASGAELSSTAAFSLNSRIPEGPFSVADVAGLYIYDNTLKAIRISGAELREYLEKSAEYYLPCPGGDCDRIVNPEVAGYNFDAITGVDYVLDLTQPVGERVVSLARNGQPVTPTDSFTLALNNYRASGAGGFNMLAKAPVVYDRGEEIRQLLIDEVQRQGVLDPSDYFEENWRIVPEELAEKAAREQRQTTRPAASASAATRNKRLRVLSTNDFHGNLKPTRPSFADGREVGGAAALAAYMNRARSEVDAPTILLDGGDVMQGTPISNLSEGRATVDFYNEIGYTAAAVGNHEFDWGAETLAERIEQAKFAWLSANVFVRGTDTLPYWGQATELVKLAGCAAGPPVCDSVTVGIIGIATTETPRAAMPSYVAPFTFGDEAAAIDRWVPILRQQGADFVIVTAHEGAYCEGPGFDDCSGPIMGIAERLQNPPDLIVSGHSHTVLNVRAGGVPIVQASTAGTRFSITDLELVSSDSVAVVVVDQPVTYVDAITPDPRVAAIVDRYEREIGPRLYQVISRVEQPLLRGAPEYPLGNLIADAQRAATDADVAIMNNGGIRIDVPAGPITYETLYRLQPFANTLVTVELTGEQLWDVLEHTVSRGRPHAHISGARVRYSPSAPDGDRLVSVTLEDGQTIDPSRVYRVTANNFMVDGGDGYTMLAEGDRIDFTGIVDLDALIAYIESLPSPLNVPAADRYIATEP